MKAIKFVQWGSAILSLTFALFLIVNGGIILYMYPDRVGVLVTLGGVVALFVGPQVLAAFFGPVLKRKQENGKENQNGS